MKGKMKRILSRLPRLPRKWKLVRNVICSLLAVYFIWVFFDCRSVTAVAAFRRMEREEMVGPSEIVYRTEIGEQVWFVGKVSDGYPVFATRGSFFGWYDYCFYYWEKASDITLVALTTHILSSGRDAVEILLLHELNGVVRGGGNGCSLRVCGVSL